jgi:nitrate/nitrite-specific signal transduction histidine kinase
MGRIFALKTTAGRELRVASRNYFCRRKKHARDQNAECDVVEIVRENVHGIAHHAQA